MSDWFAIVSETLSIGAKFRRLAAAACMFLAATGVATHAWAQFSAGCLGINTGALSFVSTSAGRRAFETSLKAGETVHFLVKTGHKRMAGHTFYVSVTGVYSFVYVDQRNLPARPSNEVHIELSAAPAGVSAPLSFARHGYSQNVNPEFSAACGIQVLEMEPTASSSGRAYH